MAELESYVKRFTERGWRVFDHAVVEARRRNQNHVCVEHIIEALAFEEADIFNALMRDLGVEPREARAHIEKLLADCPGREGPSTHIAPETIELLKRAFRRARSDGRSRITPTDLFVALSQDEHSPFYELLKDSEANLDDALRTVYDIELVLATVRSRAGKGSHTFSKGDQVRIKTGPFQSFTGRVEWVDRDAAVLKVMVTIFGHPVAVALRFPDVEKINIRSAA